MTPGRVDRRLDSDVSGHGGSEGPAATGLDSPLQRSFDSFEDLYQSLWPPMVRLAWLLSGNREVAEDLVHDVFLRIEPKWQEIREPAPYFRRSLVNAVRQHQRHAEVEARHRPEPVRATMDPEFEEIWSVVSEIPERQREALVLRFYLDLTVEQVADNLQCPVGTAKSLIHRGVASVREKVEQ